MILKIPLIQPSVGMPVPVHAHFQTTNLFYWIVINPLSTGLESDCSKNIFESRIEIYEDANLI
jgi:hypothetical protein